MFFQNAKKRRNFVIHLHGKTQNYTETVTRNILPLHAALTTFKDIFKHKHMQAKTPRIVKHKDNT